MKCIVSHPSAKSDSPPWICGGAREAESPVPAECGQSDAALLAAVVQGDTGAFEALFLRYWARVYHFVVRYLGDRSAAEDATQEVFFKVFRAAGHFKDNGNSNAAAWIFKIAYHVSLNELKRRSCVTRKLRDFWCWTKQNPGGCTTAQTLARANLEGELHRALQQIPETQRAALMLRVNEGLSYAEISHILNKSISSVESLIFRARTQLKKLLRDQV